jgi:hypothetical protein
MHREDLGVLDVGVELLLQRWVSGEHGIPRLASRGANSSSSMLWRWPQAAQRNCSW